MAPDRRFRARRSDESMQSIGEAAPRSLPLPGDEAPSRKAKSGSGRAKKKRKAARKARRRNR